MAEESKDNASNGDKFNSVAIIEAPFLRIWDESNVRKFLSDFVAYETKGGSLPCYRLIDPEIVEFLCLESSLDPRTWKDTEFVIIKEAITNCFRTSDKDVALERLKAIRMQESSCTEFALFKYN